MDDSWIVSNLNAALTTWNDKLGEIWQLLTQSPQTFKDGQVWAVMVGIHGALQAIGYGLPSSRSCRGWSPRLLTNLVCWE